MRGGTERPLGDWRAAAVAALLAAGVAVVYAPVAGPQFLAYDDPNYVVDNPAMRAGLTRASIRWSLTATDVANWHIVTWWSHMLDVSLFGLDAGRHLLDALDPSRARRVRRLPRALDAALEALGDVDAAGAQYETVLDGQPSPERTEAEARLGRLAR